MKITLTLIGAAAALGLAGAAIAQTDSSSMGNSSMSSTKSGKKMHHSRHMKTSSQSATGTDTNGMRGADSGSAGGASPNGGDATPTAPGNSTTPQ